MEFNFGIFACCFIAMFCIFQQKCFVYSQNTEIGGELNYPCTSVRDCRYFGYVCRDNTCQCDQWYVPDKDRRICVGGVDQKCLYDEHCIIGAFCMNQSICKCKHSSSQSLDHGLVCAGAADLKKHLLGPVFLVIGITFGIFRQLYS